MSEPYSYHVTIRPWEAKHEQDTPIYQHRTRSADLPSTPRKFRGRLVLKHARPRVLAAGMPLLADAAEISEHPILD